VLIVVGDVDLEDVLAKATVTLGDWKAESLPPSALPPEADGDSHAAAIYLVDHPAAAQSVIRAIQATIPRRHPDYFGLTVLNYAFGGQFTARLNQNLRQDKGYSYGFHSAVHWYHGPSLLFAGGSVQTAVTKEAVKETLKEFHDVRGPRPISQEEMEGAKAAILQSYPASFERPALIMNHLLQLAVYDLPGDYFRTVKPQVEAVSLDEARRVAVDWIRPDRLKVLVVGDRQVVEPGLRELGLPLVLLDDDGSEL
jgi:zinc protease